jgi:hypothetical protein
MKYTIDSWDDLSQLSDLLVLGNRVGVDGYLVNLDVVQRSV